MTRMSTDLYGEGYWERGVGSNYHEYGNDPHWPQTIDALKASLPVDLVVGPWLEVACAKGYFVLEAKRRGLDVVGVDLSEYAISQAPGEVKPYVQVGTVLSLPFGEEFGVLVAWEFMEHVPQEDLDDALDEMARVLLPGGMVVLRIGTADPDPRFTGYAERDHSHFTEMPSPWWRARFEARGWVRVPDVEAALNEAHADIDWVNRFFAYRVA